MSSNKPNLKTFEDSVREQFGQTLNQRAQVAIRDLHRNWEEIYTRVKSDEVKFEVNATILNHKFPHLGRAGLWAKLRNLCFLLGGGLLFVSAWVGVLLIGLGLASFAFQKQIFLRDSVRFGESMTQKVLSEPFSSGMAEVAVHYISGTVAMMSAKGSSRWPQYPSCVLTGQERMIAY